MTEGDCCGEWVGKHMAELAGKTKFVIEVEKDGMKYLQVLKFKGVKSKSDYAELEPEGDLIPYMVYTRQHDIGIDFIILAENWVKPHNVKAQG